MSSSVEERLRHERAVSLFLCLDAADPDDAAAIAVAFLEGRAVGMPGFGPFAELRANAAWWADRAHAAELEAVLTACLAKLPGKAVALGPRKRMLVALWRSLPEDDRRAFLEKIAKVPA